jgi:hypothetical protein
MKKSLLPFPYTPQILLWYNEEANPVYLHLVIGIW